MFFLLVAVRMTRDPARRTSVSCEYRDCWQISCSDAGTVIVFAVFESTGRWKTVRHQITIGIAIMTARIIIVGVVLVLSICDLLASVWSTGWHSPPRAHPKLFYGGQALGRTVRSVRVLMMIEDRDLSVGPLVCFIYIICDESHHGL